MTTIRKIVTSKVDGDNANNTTANEIRPFGEISVYQDTSTNPDKLTLMMFDGTRTHLKSKVLAPGRLYGSDADSGDGNGLDTIKLIPDATLYNNNSDQYLVVDPTVGEPGHIHIRAGGTQDSSTADLYLGGELTCVRVSDTSGIVTVRTTNVGDPNITMDWSFQPDGNLYFPGIGNNRIGESEPGLVVSSDYSVVLQSNNTGVSNELLFGTDGNLTLPNSITMGPGSGRLISVVTPEPGLISWEFGMDGNLTVPGNINYANGVNILTGIGGTYNNTNVAAYLTAFDGNIVPDANVTYDLGSSTNRWRDLWLSGNTINLGAATISANGSAVALPVGSTISGQAISVYSDSNVASYLPTDSTIIALQANAALQASLIDTLSGNAASQGGVLLDLVANAATQATTLTTLLGNAATQATELTILIGNASAQSGAITDLQSNATVQANAIDTISANIGLYQTYANTELGFLTNSIANINGSLGSTNQLIGTVGDNLSAYQTFANANAAAQATAIDSINANVGAFQTYANTQINNFVAGTGFATIEQLTANVDTINANVGSFQTYANITFGTSSYGNTEVAAYLPTYTGNISAENVRTTTGVSIGSGNTTATVDYVSGDLRISAGYQFNVVPPTAYSLEPPTDFADGDLIAGVGGDFKVMRATVSGGWSSNATTAFGALTTSATNLRVQTAGAGTSPFTTLTSVEYFAGNTSYILTFVDNISFLSDWNVSRFELTVSANIDTKDDVVFYTGGRANTELLRIDGDTKQITVQGGIYWANGAAYGGSSGSDEVLRANVGAFQTYANTQINSFVAGTGFATIDQLTANVNTINANIGSFQTYANATFGGGGGGGGSAVTPDVSFVCRTGTKTLDSSTSQQSIFGGGDGGLTTGALTVNSATTYFFEMQFSITSMSSSLGNFFFSLVGAGTAAFDSCQFMVTGADSNPNTGTANFNPVNQSGSFIQGTAHGTGAALNAASATGAYCVIRGVFRIFNGGGGTIIPSIALQTAASAIISTNSWFRCYPIGDNTVISVGNWE